jgi:hypothetical protein
MEMIKELPGSQNGLNYGNNIELIFSDDGYHNYVIFTTGQTTSLNQLYYFEVVVNPLKGALEQLTTPI